MSTAPSRFTVGARVFPWQDHGLSLLAAFDVGTGATSKFVEEIAPELPWNFYFALGYAIDTVAPKPVIQQVPAPAPVAVASRENVIEGLVVEKNTTNAIPDAIIKYDGRPLTGMISGPDGTFRSEKEIVATGTGVLRALLGAYQTAAASVSNPAYGVLYASLAASVSQQLATLAAHAGQNVIEPFPTAMDLETASDALETYLG